MKKENFIYLLMGLLSLAAIFYIIIYFLFFKDAVRKIHIVEKTDYGIQKKPKTQRQEIEVQDWPCSLEDCKG